MPIRALYGWEYWHQPNNFSVDLMQQAFRGYFDVIACSAKYSKAWDFASCVGGETLLLDRWGGKRLHEEIPMEDQLSSSTDDRSEDSASVSSLGTVIKKRPRSTKDIALQSQSAQKRRRKTTVKRVSSTVRRWGHSSSMAQKTRAGRRGSASIGSSLPSAGQMTVSVPVPDTGTTTVLPIGLPSPLINDRVTHTKALLLGMVYTRTSLMHCKRQLTRDGIRCRAFEHTEQETVFTIDNTHNDDQGEEGRHIRHDFTNPGVFGCMDRQW